MLMELTEVEQAKQRLQDILQRARQLNIPTREVLSTRFAQKFLARTENAVVWKIFFVASFVLLSVLVYVHWPTQEVETVRTVLSRSCGTVPGDISERVAAILYTSSTQDDC